jgi:hypothetical protein
MRVDAGDTHVKRIFVKYETDKDVYHLIDSLKALNLGEESEEADEEVSLINLPAASYCALGLLYRVGQTNDIAVTTTHLARLLI